MKSYPLTTADKFAIENGLLEGAFGDRCMYTVRKNEWVRLSKKWGMEIYNLMYTPAERRKMKSLPKGWMGEFEYIKVNLQRPGKDSLEAVLKLPEFVRMAFTDTNRYLDLKEDKYDMLVAALVEDLEAVSELMRKHRSASNAIVGQLKKIRTTKQLAEQWPEAFKHCPSKGETGTALSVPIAEVNKLLGIGA